MTAASALRARLLGVVLGERFLEFRRRLGELRRRLARAPHVVTTFLELDDPYSYLLSTYLEELSKHYAVELRLCLTEALRGEYRAAPDLYPEYALADCRRLAAELGVPFLDLGAAPPVEYRRALLDMLAAQDPAPDFAQEFVRVLRAYWRGDVQAVGRLCRTPTGMSGANAVLGRNQALLTRLGHYDTATLHYGGEWYRGVERLQYLVDRFDALGLARLPGLAPRIASIRQVMRPVLPVSPPAAAQSLPPLEMFYSLRSPYSWLAFDRLTAIADAFAVRLEFRPVLPMAMRALPIPRRKLRYLAFDASREARRHGVPFGRFTDPLGAGVERLMAVWQYAIGMQREREFLRSAGDAIWHRGIDVTTDAGLAQVATATGLSWPDARQALGDDSWRAIAAANHEALREAGAWGAPTVRIGDWVTWGQDRDWLVARRLEELCDGGDGILV
jgi:2-hydroxychromene-2-carboxylate isomerase